MQEEDVKALFVLVALSTATFVPGVAQASPEMPSTRLMQATEDNSALTEVHGRRGRVRVFGPHCRPAWHWRRGWHIHRRWCRWR
jgi:hypothetical protein